MFQFTIRELLIVTVTVGIGAGWWLDRNAMILDRKAMEIDKERAILRALLNSYEPCGFSQDQAGYQEKAASVPSRPSP